MKQSSSVCSRPVPVRVGTRYSGADDGMVHRSRVRGAWMHSPLLTRRAFLGGLSLSTLALASIYRTIHPPRTPAASPAPAEDGDAIEIPPSPPPLRVVSADPDDAAAAAARALRDFLGERLPD